MCSKITLSTSDFVVDQSERSNQPSIQLHGIFLEIYGDNRYNVLKFDIPYMGAYLGKGPYWQLITLCWLYFGVMFQI